MKKILALFITVLLLISSFSFAASAAKADNFAIETDVEYADLDPNATISFSDDYKTLNCGDDLYSSFSVSSVTADIYAEVKNSVYLNDEQERAIEDYELSATKKGNIISVCFYFNDGSSLNISYLNDAYREEYNKILNNESSEYFIDFSYEEENIVETTKSELYGEKVTLDSVNDLLFNNYYDVGNKISDGSFYVVKGQLLDYDSEYYYIEFKENGIDYDGYFYASEYDKPLIAYKITNLELLQKISSAEDIYFSEDFGFFFDEDFTENVANIFLVLVFGIIPLGVFILFLILSFKAKKVYKKLFTVIYSIAAAELIVFTTIALLIIK